LCQLLGHAIGVQKTGIESQPSPGAKAGLGQCLSRLRDPVSP
jgi:hypothetical protein